MSRIISEFDAVCRENSDRTAFVFIRNGHMVNKTYRELAEDMQSKIKYLLKCGVKYGDKILAFANESYELCVFMLASMRIGASIMYVDIWARQDRLRNAFAQYMPDYVVVSRKTAKFKMFFREIHKIKNVLYVENSDEAFEIPADLRQADDDTNALLTMTTGSTGKPKIAIRTHRHLLEQLKLVSMNLDGSLAHEYVLTTSYMYVFANILSGFTTVLTQVRLAKDSTKTLENKLRRFENVPVSMIITSPDFCLKTRNIFPDLKKVYFGGAILTLNEAKTIVENYGDADIEYIYGATECNLISKVRLSSYIDRLANDVISVLGRVVDGVKIKIGEHNEIMVTSGALLESYLNVDCCGNKSVDDDNVIWHTTGDAGEYKDGMLYYFGRNDMYIPLGGNGKRVYSSQVEQNLIVKFDFINKCAVICKSNKLYLFVEIKKGKKYSPKSVINYLCEKYGIEQIEVKKMSKIPCDVKHHTKINYTKLKKKIKGW
ncbi:MAG: class I adenylate-forming enzyme family protein [Firmicutes bacterium]|nr:class I adenylate-forming enzyme family protein [Bacillota bacterium]